tara:strand:+ start:2721 stop:3428 length:708 start_codon:yes stop_codon:yes gene_type:complete
MKALILAAGLGSRLRPLTEKIPKAMVKFQGIELIKHQILTLYDQNINDITIVVGYKSEVLVNFIKKNFNSKINIIKNDLYQSSNSAYSSMGAFEGHVDSDYIHINCDILFSSSLLSSLVNDKRKNVLAVRGDLTLTESMENIIGLEGRIVNMALRCSDLAKFKGFGLAKISKEALKENISFYKTLNETKQKEENYYGLIRMTLGKIEYHYLESNANNLSELNTLDDLENCRFKFE